MTQRWIETASTNRGMASSSICEMKGFEIQARDIRISPKRASTIAEE